MARRKDLTALAALGTLGYMLSKRGDKKDDKKAETPSLENLPVARPSMKPNPLIAAGEEQGKTKGSGDAYMAEYYAKKERSPEAIQEADNPRVSSPASKPTASASKPAASKPAKATTSRINRDYEAEQQADNPIGSRSMVGVPGTLDKKGVISGADAPMRGARSDAGTSPPVQTHFGPRDEENAPRGKIDVTKYSLEDRRKMPSDRAPTDYRAVKDRFRKGGAVKGYASGGSVSSASKRADGIATRGKTKCKMY
jgi:hypothetical protein